MSQQLTRTLFPEIKVISAATGEVDFIASDASLDSYREIILARGWRFDRFAKNAPLVDSHNYYDTAALLGRVVHFEVRGGKLLNRARFAVDVPSNVRARMAFDMVEAGYLRAVSVGFFPEEFATPATPEQWAKAVKAAGLDTETAAQCRCIYMTQQQIELSVCIIGANPNALVKAYDAGVIHEEQLRAIGFERESDLDFLLRAGRAMETAPEAERIMLARAVYAGIPSSRARQGHDVIANDALRSHTSAHDSPPVSPPDSPAYAGDAGESRRRSPDAARCLIRELERRALLARLS